MWIGNLWTTAADVDNRAHTTPSTPRRLSGPAPLCSTQRALPTARCGRPWRGVRWVARGPVGGAGPGMWCGVVWALEVALFAQLRAGISYWACGADGAVWADVARGRRRGAGVTTPRR